MVKKKYQSKRELVEKVIERKSEIIGNTVMERGLLDSLIPLSGMDGEVKSINDDGTVVIEFSAPIDAYLDLLTRKKLMSLLELMDEFNS